MTDSESDSRTTSSQSQSVDEEMNINEVGVAAWVGAPTLVQEHSTMRKCYSLAMSGLQRSADVRTKHVQQLHHIVHVSSYIH